MCYSQFFDTQSGFYLVTWLSFMIPGGVCDIKKNKQKNLL